MPRRIPVLCLALVLLAASSACAPTSGQPGAEPAEADRLSLPALLAEPGDPAPAADDPAVQAAPELRRIAQLGGIAQALALDGDLVALGSGTRVHLLDASDPARPRLLGQGPILPRVVRDLALREGLAYVAADRAGLQVLDVRDPSAPRLLGAHATESQALGIAVAGGRAYLAASRDGLLILDITAPGAPRLLGRWPAPDRLLDVALSDGDPNTVFVADENAGLVALDVRDPAAPRPIGGIDRPGHVRRLTVDGPHAFLLTDRDELAIVDVTQPDRARVVSTLPWAAPCGEVCPPPDIAVAGNRAILSGERIAVLDLTDPTSPRILEPAPRTEEDDVRGTPAYSALALRGDHLFALRDPMLGSSQDTAGLSVFDLGRPAMPREVGRYALPGEIAWPHLNALPDRRELLLGHHRIDVADPMRPVLRGTLPIDPSGDVAARGDVLFATSSWEVLHALRLADDGSAEALGSLTTITESFGAGMMPEWGGDTIAVAGDRAYVAGSAFGWGCPHFGVVDVADPARPRLLGSLAFTPSREDGRLGLSLNLTGVETGSDGFVYLTAGLGECDSYWEPSPGLLQVVDVRDPNDPYVVGELDVNGTVRGLALHESVAYLAAEDDGLVIVDVSDPASPRRLASQAFEDRTARGLALAWPYAVVGAGKRLELFDVRDPARPSRQSSTEIPARALDMLWLDGQLWVVADEAGILGFELATPSD